jgi:hypothetical protein
VTANNSILNLLRIIIYYLRDNYRLYNIVLTRYRVLSLKIEKLSPLLRYLRYRDRRSIF